MTPTPLDLDALEAALVAWHNGAPANPIMSAAPALIAMARERDADVRYVLERQIGAEVLADENGRAATAAHAEIARLREALEAAEARLTHHMRAGELTRDVMHSLDQAEKDGDALDKVRAALG